MIKNIIAFSLGAIAAIAMAIAIYTTAYNYGIYHAIHDSTITTDGIYAYVTLDGNTHAYFTE